MIAIVHVTCASIAEAQRIAKALLDAKLIACAAWWPVRSHFRWRGKLERAREAMLELKTLPKFVAAVSREIKKRHSYELPVITVMRVASDKAVERWVKTEVGYYLSLRGAQATKQSH